MPDKYLARVDKNKVKKGDRVHYIRKGRKEYGYYVGKQKSHANLKRSSVTPRGIKKGRTYLAIWNPHNLASGGSNEANVFLPKNAVKKVMRGYQRKQKGKRMI